MTPSGLGKGFAGRAIGKPFRIATKHNQHRRNQHSCRHNNNGHHDRHELKKVHARYAIEEEVLRIPNGQQHATQIRRHRHENHHGGRKATLPRLGEHDKGKRDKGDKGHVVGYRHGANEG